MIDPRTFAFEITGFSLDGLEAIAEDIDSHYFQREIPKGPDVEHLWAFGLDDAEEVAPTTGSRTITESREPLKTIQARIRGNLLDALSWPEYVQGGIKNRSNVTNARRHMGKKHHFLTDIKDFFPSVSHKMVYRVFSRELGLMSDAARLATRLTTYDYGLPQGTTTSPFLANLAFLPVDERLATACSRHGITYTRFVDDLTFSAPHDFIDRTEELCRIIIEADFRIKDTKTHYRSRPVEITGVVVENDELLAPDRLKEKLSLLDPDSSKHEGLASYIEYVESYG